MSEIGLGERIGKYRILSEIGRGGMGIVYLAEDTSLERDVALKVLPPRLLTDGTFVARFKAEAKAVAALAHPNIVHVNAFEVVDDSPVIEMEYIAGGSLARMLQEEFVTAPTVVRYAAETAGALAYCSGLDVLHRDIKPSNILIDSFDHARIADFGLAEVLSESARVSLSESNASVFMGTPLYAPPEAWDTGEHSHAWDVYSLGVVLYEALTGTPPHQADSPLVLMKKVSTEPIVPVRKLNEQVSEPLEALVHDMLHRESEQRPDSFDGVQKRLQGVPEYPDQVASETVTIALPKRRRVAKQKPHSKSQGSWVLLGLLVVGLFVALSVGLGREQSAVTDQTPLADVPPVPEGVALQSPARQSLDTTASALLAIPKDLPRDRTTVFEVAYHGNDAPVVETWLGVLDDNGHLAEVFLQSNARLGVLALQKVRDGSYTCIGNWASYRDRSGTVLRFGTATGTLGWSGEDGALVGSLQFVCEQDGGLVEVSLTGSAHERVQTDAQFIHQMERAEYIQSLIVRELLPRDAAWVEPVARMMPAFAEGLASVAQSPAAADHFTLDGALEDELWAGEPGRVASLLGIPHEVAPLLRLVCTEDMLLVSATGAGAVPEGGLLFSMRVLRSAGVPVQASPHLHVSYGTTEDSAVGTYRSGDTVLAHTNVTFRAGVADNRWVLEGAIPLAALGPSMQWVESPELWRLNAQVEGIDAEGAATVLARWGYPETDAVHHGAVLRVEPSRSKRELM
jgi:serine/threonine protein kinase